MSKRQRTVAMVLRTMCFSALLLASQTAAMAQSRARVTIKKSNTTIVEALKQIEKQTGMFAEYNHTQLNKKPGINVNLHNATVDEALQRVLSGSGFSYQIKGDQIIIVPVGATEKQRTNGAKQQNGKKQRIQGRVLDKDGMPLIGVSVRTEGAGNEGTVTDMDGNFSFEGTAGRHVVVSYIGYKNQTLKAGDNMNVVLQEDSKLLGDVVVTALGIKREQKALSYNVQQLKGDELNNVKDANFANSLVGKVAGVQINSGASGAGGSVRVVMRGAKSIEKDNNVLYVIDGIPMYNHSFGGTGGSYAQQTGSESSADINPEDIESINMLTGPSAAALYGSDAANGAVIINTKRGAKDRTTVTVSNSTMFSKATMLPETQSKYGTSTGLMNWGAEVNSDFDPAKFFNTGSSIINSVALSTGNSKNQTYISASTTNTQGIIVGNKYDRYNFTARNTTSLLNDKLVIDFGASYILQKDQNMVSQGKYYNPLPALYLFPRSDNFDEVRNFERWDPVLGYNTQYWPYGEGAHSLQNPYWIQKRMNRTTDKTRYMFNASVKYNIFDWMNVTGRVRVDNSEYRIRNKMYASTLTTFCDSNGGYEDQTQHDKSVYGDIMLNINKTLFNDYSVAANIGASINDQRFEAAGGAGNLLLTNHFAMNNINYESKYKPIQSGWHDQTQSIFASLELGYKSMLYLTMTGRNDWASQLAFSNQSSFFYPSVGMSAVVSNMVKMPKGIDFLKVRASYSKVASAFSRFLSNPSYTYNNQTHQWQKPNTAPLDNMKPEDTKSWELGVNAKFLNNTINFDLTLYRSNTYHQTIYAASSSSSLYNRKIEQTGNIQNQGIELAVGYNNQWGKLGVQSNLTYTINQNRIKQLSPDSRNNKGIPEIQKDYLGASSVAPQVILYEGGSMSDIYIKHELARDNNGAILLDKNGNLSIMETEPRKAGSLTPKYNFGWSNTIKYDGLSLGFVLTARVGGLCYSATQGILDYYGASQATADARDAGGIAINNGTVPAQNYYQTISTAEGGYGAYYLYSATNVRLQELSLSYDLPKRWFGGKMRASVGFVARNLWMIYCKAPFDPELSGATSSTYYQGVDYFMQPSTRNFGFNVKLQF